MVKVDLVIIVKIKSYISKGLAWGPKTVIFEQGLETVFKL